MNSVANRKESSAEHTWSCLILADYFIDKFNMNLDRLKVYELLIYHDMIEIEAGDTPLSLNQDLNEKKERETRALNKLIKELPDVIAKKLEKNFNEFEERKTREAKFAKAIDAFDPLVQVIDHKDDFKVWIKEETKKILNSKIKYFEEFPEIRKFFDELILYFEENNYF